MVKYVDGKEKPPKNAPTVSRGSVAVTQADFERMSRELDRYMEKNHGWARRIRAGEKD